MTLRSRITLLTAILLLVSSSILAGIAYTTSARIQMQSIDRALNASVSEPRIRNLILRPATPATDDYTPVALGVLTLNSQEVTVLRTAGTTTDPLPFPTLTADNILEAKVRPVTVTGSPDYRVVARLLGGKRGTVIAVTPLGDMDDNLRTFAAGMILSVVLITVLGAAVSWAAVRRFFRPVDAMVASAQTIARGDTSRRVPNAPAGTELGDLSEALNLMIVSLTESIATVEASEDRLRTFVSDASHEIRTPLTVIRGYIELLQREHKGESELETRALARIDAESDRLQRLVTELLLLESLETPLTTKAEDVDLTTIIRDTFGDLAVLDGGRPVNLDLDEAVISGRVDSWQQAIANIARNISTHTPAGSTVNVSLHHSNTTTTLTVDDSGPGISADDRERLRQRFARLDPTKSGYGLGLSVIQTVVEAHGGTLDLSESPSGGLRVQIVAPNQATR